MKGSTIRTGCQLVWSPIGNKMNMKSLTCYLYQKKISTFNWNRKAPSSYYDVSQINVAKRSMCWIVINRMGINEKEKDSIVHRDITTVERSDGTHVCHLWHCNQDTSMWDVDKFVVSFFFSYSHCFCVLCCFCVVPSLLSLSLLPSHSYFPQLFYFSHKNLKPPTLIESKGLVISSWGTSFGVGQYTSLYYGPGSGSITQSNLVRNF